MKIFIYPKSQLERSWREERKVFTQEPAAPPLCLRCGQPLNIRPAVNATSRYANVRICQSCGMDEAMRDFDGDPLPFSEWHALTSGRIKDLPFLRPANRGAHRVQFIFRNRVFLCLAAADYPEQGL